jgi:hypothetical protein
LIRCPPTYHDTTFKGACRNQLGDGERLPL